MKNKIKAQLEAPEGLRKLADWFDKEQDAGRWGGKKGSKEVQEDLRQWACEFERMQEKIDELRQDLLMAEAGIDI